MAAQGTPPPPVTEEAFIFALERPLPKLLTHYLLQCAPFLLFPPLGLALILVHYFRYQTLRYHFDEEGISMRWGILFRKEILLNYSRIQDIHLVSGVLERWLGLARIQIQTASGSATPEMTLEGLPDHERVRDFLYARMRGTRDLRLRPHPSLPTPADLPAIDPAAANADLASVLREAAADLRAIRTHLERNSRP